MPIKSITRKSLAETISYETKECQGSNVNKCFKLLFEKILNAQRGIEDSGHGWSVEIKDANTYAPVTEA